jgi:hypothetical protein
MEFFLGIHAPGWLGRIAVPAFVSRRRLAQLKRLPRAQGPWALDSGGFSELSLFGEWRTSPTQYLGEIRRYQQEIGGLEWAAPQDWMCERVILEKTGRSMREHQALTIRNFLELRERAPELPIIPVLQGQTTPDYLRHADDYEAAGVDLAREPLTGLGSVCRRQAMGSALETLALLQRAGLQLHGFGLKKVALAAGAHLLHSADSMAWSLVARRERRRLDGCTHTTCRNCLRFALVWREGVLRAARLPKQLALDWGDRNAALSGGGGGAGER